MPTVGTALARSKDPSFELGRRSRFGERRSRLLRAAEATLGRAAITKHLLPRRCSHPLGMLTVLLWLCGLPRAASAAHPDPVASVLRGDDVVQPVAGKGTRMRRAAVVPPAVLASPALGPLWMLSAQVEPIELGDGRSIYSIESYGLFSAVLPTGERFRDKNAGDLLADHVVDATPAGWLHACATDGRGRVAVVKEQDWPTSGFPSVSEFKKLVPDRRPAVDSRRGNVELNPQVGTGFLRVRGEYVTGLNLM